jgi:hypothetical protein
MITYCKVFQYLIMIIYYAEKTFELVTYCLTRTYQNIKKKKKNERCIFLKCNLRLKLYFK